MPSFDRDALRKGTKAIDEALEARKNGGEFRPFLQNIFWKNDKDFRYLLFLNPIEEIPQVEFHPYVDLDDDVPHMTMARTDPSIGDKADPIHDQWGYKPRLTNLAIAVELEPMMKIVNGREKPAGFEVAVRTFERAIRNDEGEKTDETEEVTVPIVGLVAQSPFNFFNQLRSFDASEAPVHTTPLKITRLGKKENVTYQVVGYENVELDRTNLLEYIENISYVTNPEELLGNIAELDEADACTAIGDYFLYRRIEEFADDDLYQSILGGITKPAKFGDSKEKKPARKARPSQRRTKEATEEEPTPEAQVTKTSPAAERLAKLKAKSKEAAKAA